MKISLLLLFFTLTFCTLGQTSEQLYDRVQAIYLQYNGAAKTNCNLANSLVNQLNSFIYNTTAVPSNRAYSVSYHGQVANPTIGDLAKDRIARMKDYFSDCFTNDHPQSSIQYNEVQNIYLQYSSIPQDACDRVNALISQLTNYSNSTIKVPEKQAYTVNYPNTVQNPTIADLTKDRIARVKNHFSSCFITPASPESTRVYGIVQGLYTRALVVSNSDCPAYKSLVTQLEAYTSYEVPVPAQYAYSVNFPSKVENPQIKDLAKDRIARLKSDRKHCFPANEMSDYINKHLPGHWTFTYDNRVNEFLVTKEAGGVIANFTKHGYSYEPILESSKMTTYNGVQFVFKVGPVHHVEIQLHHNEGGIAGFIKESWTSDVWNGVYIQTVAPINNTQEIVETQAPVAVQPTYQGPAFNKENFDAKVVGTWRYHNGDDHYLKIAVTQVNGEMRGTFLEHIYLYDPVFQYTEVTEKVYTLWFTIGDFNKIGIVFASGPWNEVLLWARESWNGGELDELFGAKVAE